MRIHAVPAVAASVYLLAACVLDTDDAGEFDPGTVSEPIIGGALATAYPEAVIVDATKFGVTERCSGAIIAPRVVLTAGHCVHSYKQWKVKAPYAGNQERTSSSAETYDWTSSGSVLNKDQHDIGLIYLSTEIALSSYPALTTAPVANTTQVVSIGRVNNNTVSSSALYVAPPTPVSQSMNFPFDYYGATLIKAGDSGGPVELPGTTPHVIAAVNSGSGATQMYLARVDLVYAWISEKIASHGGGGGGSGGGGSAGGGGSGGGGGPTCTNESEPNDTYAATNALSGTKCAALSAPTDQDWYAFTVAASPGAYDLTLTAASDAQIYMWRLVNGQWVQVTGSSPTHFAQSSNAGGNYLLAVWTPGGVSQNYTLALSLPN